MDWPIRVDDVLAAEKRLRSFLPETPLRSYAELDDAVGCHVLVKHENHQPTNAFKVRNGLSALTGLGRDACRRGVVAASRGNHGLGLAYAGHQLGIPVTVCVPEGNNSEKNAAIEGFGARLVVGGKDYDEAVTVAHRHASDEELRLVHSTGEPLVLAGAGTLTLESLRQAEAMGESIAAMFVSIGGGSQAVGALTVLRNEGRNVPVIGVQAANAPAVHDSYHAGKKIEGKRSDTFADGVATRVPHDLTFAALRDGLADMITVTERQIADAVRLFLTCTHNLAEGAGAVGLAGLQKLASQYQGKTILVILSGANIDDETLRRIVCGEIT